MKKNATTLLCLLLSLLLLFALTACGGSGGNDGKNGESEEAAQENANPYNLDYESSELQLMSDERAGLEVLVETKNEFFQDLNVFTGTDLTKLTYEDVVAHIGVDPSAYQYEPTYGRRIYFWYAEGSASPWLGVYFNKDGTLYGSSSANLN